MLKQICVNLIILLCVGSSFAVLEDSNFKNSHKSLQEECSLEFNKNQNRTDDNSGMDCDSQCSINQWTKGCTVWHQALDTGCKSVCNGTHELLPSKEIFCIAGCHEALNRYYYQLKARAGELSAPTLIADSLTATSLRLEWKGIDVKRFGNGILYFVQWQYEDFTETWQFCRNQSWREDDQILVYNLQSYTKYRFRIALLLRSIQHNAEIIVSSPSIVILTKPAGVPISAPKILRATAVDSYRISVSWEPGQFSNGPLLYYVLRLTYEGSQVKSKDLPPKETINYYMFRNLEPNKNYSMSVSMRNTEGDGPPAIINVITSPESIVKDVEQPLLILGSEHSIMKQGSDIFDEPSIIYDTNSYIQGIAIHVVSEQIFISDSMGYIYRKSISQHSKAIIVLSPSQIDFKPLSLSVDWLNLHLYIVGEMKNRPNWQMMRCNLDGKVLNVVVPHFSMKPSHIEVDPYNGYLFWITRRGLYRLDLAEINNEISKIQPLLIMEDSNLGAFVVDHMNFRLLVSYHSENTVKSVSLDGNEVIDLRANTQQPKFKNVSSLAVINNLFYWTNGYEVLTEGYHSGQDKYFHNVFPRYIKFSEMYISVHVLMSTSQPIPIPINPPTNVQAVLGSERAKISWQPPYLLAEQGRGAWQNWFYELEIKNDYSGETIHQIGISELTQSVFNLKEKSNYSIKATAYTSAGKSLWSKEFKGQTLRDELHASILWSTREGLLISDMIGENLDILIHNTNLKEESEYHILDLSWYKDVLYMVGNNSFLYQYNMTSHLKSSLNISSISSVAIDWISKKLYWANFKQQIIIRSNLNGSEQEPVSSLANVKKLVIDSLEAYLYWTTGYSIEVSRLNGQERRYYYSDEIFSDKQVIGLTLDLENRFVYWIIKSYESFSILYRAPTSERLPMNQKIIPEKISILEHTNIQGPLSYFSQHLLWLQDDRNAIIGDMTGQNTAVINGITLSGLHMTSIYNPTFHQLPKSLNSETIVVLPDAVDVQSIRIEGDWTSFNISWDAVNNTNYGIVFYEVVFSYVNTNSIVKLTSETSVNCNNSHNILPYTSIDVKIKAFTYWGTAHHTRKVLRSPQSTPSRPLNPRAYVEFQKDPLDDVNKINIIFRWDLPQFSNGVILGYIVKCWYITNDAEILLCDSLDTSPSKLEFTLNDLLPKMTYYFQVQAYTEIGVGAYTDIINISTENENPLPQLLIITKDMVQISDLDQQVNHSINQQFIRELTYLAADDKIFWINEMQELVTSMMNGENTTKILSLNNPANSICVDWVTRNLYWTESSYKKSNGSYIMKLDLSAWHSGVFKYKKIVSRNNRIVHLDISPSKGRLFWVELNSKQDRGIMMYSNLSGGNIKPLFNHMKDCSCPFRPVIKPVFAIDNTNSHNPTIYWVSLEGHLNEADIEGCFCNLVIGNDELPPPSSLTVDKKNVYWLSTENKNLYFVDKINPDEEVKQYHLVNAKRIKTIGKSLQPYPDIQCLAPFQGIYNVQELSKTKNSIIIKMPQPILHEICEDYNLPSTLYTIFFSECLGENKCDEKKEIKLQTYDTQLEVEQLKPFTKYRFKLALSNYYSEKESNYLNFSSGVILRTGSGIPTRPRNVTVHSLTPTTAAVYWLPPKTLNADEVNYEIHWTANNRINESKETSAVIKHAEELKDGRLVARIRYLLPNQEYKIFVRVYPSNFSQNYNQSLEQLLKMYPEPNNLTVECFPTALTIFWIPVNNLTINYSLEFTKAHFNKWQIVNISKIIKDKLQYQIVELQPKTSYKFRLKIKYPDENEFIWPSDDRFIFETLGDVPKQPLVGLVLMLSASVIISIMLFSTCYLICRTYRQRREDKKAVMSPRISEIELATLREIPRGNFVQSNALYDPLTLQSINHQDDDALLPKIKREQIILTKFLGSGAFGEVFQGTAKGLNGAGRTPVAIKTLRKGASSHEKTEFIQEAKLMSHFRHKHVLLLLGVCLETDSPLLVLELMEAGDLLSYLRSSRVIQPSDPNALTLQDLLSICEDVARGCRYLEELHFVHRDLACRNCLVSASDRQHRVVKIGDFGLARDIYKNDYYRKEGEGLLPVRWMAPESLVDGVFTSQSDVWAFGVLVWEITSLGQQPYPARTNQEVLHYVRTGGRLPKPLNCPNSLHHLMLKCWSSVERRPSFKTCLEEIINLRNTTEDSCLIQVFSSRYLSQLGSSKKSTNSEKSQQLHESTNSTLLAPKYLELLSNSSISSKNLASAYEVPKFTLTENKTNSRTSDETSNLESQIVDKQIVNKIVQREPRQRRLSVTSLKPEKRKVSIKNVRKKSRSLDSRQLRNDSGNVFKEIKKELFKSSKTSLEENVSSSEESNASLDTRPSSSLKNSITGPMKISTDVNQYNLDSESNKTFSTLSKIQKGNSGLQKAKIPLVINNALLNLLHQTPGVEDNERIITYTIINKDALRVNGS